MPLKGYRCPASAPTAGNINKVQHCLSKCPHPCVAPPLLAAMFNSERQNYHKGAYISASMLSGTGCARQTVLERTEDYYDFPVKRYWPFRGTHAHEIIEKAGTTIEKYGWLQELRMSVELVFDDILESDGKPLVITVNGTTDSYNPSKPPYPMWDMKSMADYKAMMMVRGSKPGTFSPNLQDNWVMQLNVYRWLLAHTKIPAKIKRKLKLKGTYYPAPEFLGIQGIAMMHIPRTGMPYELKVGKDLRIFNIDDIPVWPLAETEEFIRHEALKWHDWLVVGTMPPVVTEDKSWLCKGCAFNGERFKEGICFPTKERADMDLIELT